MRSLRARDPGVGVGQLAGRCWVRCPRCDRPAAVTPGGVAPARLICAHCGLARSAGRIGAAVPFRGTRCAGCGQTLPTSDRGARYGSWLVRHVRCRACGAERAYPVSRPAPDLREGVDPYFGYPLILTIMVGGHQLWALNALHVDLLARYLEAGLRERTAQSQGMTMMARLPRWMKAARARPAIVAALATLRERAETLA